MTIQEFIDARGITMEAIPSTGNPNMQDADKDMAHWLCVFKPLEDSSHSMEIPFSMGPGHKTVTVAAMRAYTGKFYTSQKANVDGWQIGGPMPQLPYGSMTTAWQEAMELCEPTPPTAEMVLDTLAADCSTLEGVRCFEDWADEAGLDQDSRKAEKIYRAIQGHASAVARYLGEGGYRELLECDRL